MQLKLKPNSRKERNAKPRIRTIMLKYGTADEDIKAGECVKGVNGRLTVASSLNCNNNFAGVSLLDTPKGCKMSYIYDGETSNSVYNFQPPYGRPVWLGSSGHPTDVEPQSGWKLVIGESINSTTFYLK